MTGGRVSRRTVTLAVAVSAAPVAVAVRRFGPSVGSGTVADHVPPVIVAGVPFTLTLLALLCVPVTAIDVWFVSVLSAGAVMATDAPATFVTLFITMLSTKTPQVWPGRTLAHVP